MWTLIYMKIFDFFRLSKRYGKDNRKPKYITFSCKIIVHSICLHYIQIHTNRNKIIINLRVKKKNPCLF